jgi:hypothetical protein
MPKKEQVEQPVASAPKVYGPSDVQSFVHGDHRHVFTDPANRLSRPGYDDDERSLPILRCPLCNDFAMAHFGFARDPGRVTLTANEVDFVERSKEEGVMQTNQLMREFARTVKDTVVAKAGIV